MLPRPGLPPVPRLRGREALVCQADDVEKLYNTPRDAQGVIAAYVPTGLGLSFEQSWSRVTDPATDFAYMSFQMNKLVSGVNYQTDAIFDLDPTRVSFSGRRISNSVPEPQTLGMLLTGLCGLPLVWRRRRERNGL